MRIAAEKITVENAREGKNNGNVAPQVGFAEVAVHGIGAGQKLLEIIHAHGKRHRQPDSRPDRVPAAHPVPELEHILRVDAEPGHLGAVGGNSHEMPGYRSLIAGFLHKPLPRRTGICHGFKGGEGLGGDNEQHGLGIHPAQGFGHMRAVDIGYKMHGTDRACHRA